MKILSLHLATGVTQDLIDETRLSTEHKMLSDMKALADSGGDLEFRGRSGETPVSICSKRISY